ncbi:BREX system ATP-binding protein BrxD [Rhodococcoides corynebacterioides]|uniref:BREX system ATP-binding protein BrxD n=1 Tax=Rhodococcoides corynebacterioides TaxID=53972 RepID=UPI001C9AA3B4|nr:BREX system ATP-binding protein BrxD [Rhodococcus corynebacterioides]MBY6363253.1 BREX system ATP-binding protein BrxD [Rhodococcus corynebacterioides]
MAISPVRRREILQALRHGTVPSGSLDVLAVGIDRFQSTVEEDLDAVVSGGSMFKAVRGEYGSGKTFFARWVAQMALQRGMAVAEVQVNVSETPLHKLQAIYRRSVESLRTESAPPSALRNVIDAWLYAIEEDAAELSGRPEPRPSDVTSLMEKRLEEVSRVTPAFPMALRAYYTALERNDVAVADALLAWIGGQPNVSAAAKARAGIRGEVDHNVALGFLQGLLAVLRGARHPGLLLVIDEVETVQRMRSDVREKALNSLRQLVDEVDSGRYPGLYVLVTGTPAFFDGRMGVQQLEPLAQRLHTDFSGDVRFDNPRAPQLRLSPFDFGKLIEVGRRVRDVYIQGATDGPRIRALVDEDYIHDLAAAVAGKLGGQVGIAPRLFLRKLVLDVLDKVDQFPDFDPREHYTLMIGATEMTDSEREVLSAEDVQL